MHLSHSISWITSHLSGVLALRYSITFLIILATGTGLTACSEGGSKGGSKGENASGVTTEGGETNIDGGGTDTGGGGTDTDGGGTDGTDTDGGDTDTGDGDTDTDNGDPPPDEAADIEKALFNEDHTLVSEEDLYEFIKTSLKDIQSRESKFKNRIFEGIKTPLSWDPTHDSTILTPLQLNQSQSVLFSNKNSQDNSTASLLIMGEKSEHRYAAAAANLFAVDRSTETDRVSQNLVDWLMETSPNASSKNIVLAHVPEKSDSWYFPHVEGVSTWFDEHFGSFTIIANRECDYEKLVACLDTYKPALIIISDLHHDNNKVQEFSSAIEEVAKRKIPIFYASYSRGQPDFAGALYNYMAIQGKNNYWSKHRLEQLSTSDMLSDKSSFALQIETFLDKVRAGNWNMASVEACETNYLYCHDPDFSSLFRSTADQLRTLVQGLDHQGISPFFEGQDKLIAALLLLTDKFRARIDYPIAISEPKAWMEAMLADWMVSYARRKNIAQPDLGAFVKDKSLVEKNANAHYKYPATTTDSRTISVPYTNQWTTTGWYALPGKKITLTQTDHPEVSVTLQLNYHRSNTNRTHNTKEYRFPLEVSQKRIPLKHGIPQSFSTPYGGPIYLHLSGASENTLSTTVKADNIAHHPTIMNYSDNQQIQTFNTLINSTELPHIDLRTDGAEQHLRKDRFNDAIGSDIPDVTTLLKAISENHIASVYTLAGFKIQGQSLKESLPNDVKSICSSLFGDDDCYNTDLHTRMIIQHANYDQNAHCGIGCSGNPWDSGTSISPAGWLDNHELGHNLQINLLNVQYASAEDKNDWSGYGSRAGENSNNIFPYFVKWKTHHIINNQTAEINDGHMNQKDLFFVFQSDVLNKKDSGGNRVVFGANCKAMDTGDRFEGPWQSNKYAIHNGYRMAFYHQLYLRNHKQSLASGGTLDNGFHLATLMYLHARIFSHYAKDETLWNANKTRLGFDAFPFSGHTQYGGRQVRNMPGNDFMLVSLSKITGKDWRPYFDMFGLRYTDLASQQVQSHGGSAVATGMYVIEENLPKKDLTSGLTFMTFTSNASQTWPDGSTPNSCTL